MALPVAARWACDKTATIIGDAMLDRYVYGDVSGTLNETRHLYDTEPSKWQVVEERVWTSSSTNRQFVWGLRYIDDLILRDRDTDGNGTLDERLYCLQDANWNVTGLVSTSGVIQQRSVYTAYGLPVFLSSSFTAGSKTVGWEVLYAGYRFETATSLMHVRHRVLNAALGCWVQRDPIGYADGPALYVATHLSPLTTVDPSGQGILIGVAIFVIVVAGITYVIVKWVAPYCGADVLTGRTKEDPCKSDDAMFSCAFSALRDCGFGNVADKMKQDMDDGKVCCNPDPAAHGTNASTVQPLDGPCSTRVLTPPPYNCGDLAMQLIGEYGWRVPPFRRNQNDVDKLARCLEKQADLNRRPTSKKWEHP